MFQWLVCAFSLTLGSELLHRERTKAVFGCWTSKVLVAVLLGGYWNSFCRGLSVVPVGIHPESRAFDRRLLRHNILRCRSPLGGFIGDATVHQLGHVGVPHPGGWLQMGRDVGGVHARQGANLVLLHL